MERLTHRTKQASKRTDRSDHATTNLVLDDRIRLIVFQLLERGRLLSLDSVINTGKEANVFLGKGPQGPVAVKVFSTSIMAFRKRVDYIEGEHRFESITHSQRTNSRRLVKLWAEKEYRNILRIVDIGTICIPTPYFLADTLIGMEFLGVDEVPAPRLRDVADQFSETRLEKAYWSILRGMRDLYHKGGLVHGDLSEYNILYLHKKLWIIDVGQAVDITHPEAAEFLKLDIFNISCFFARLTVPILTCQDALNFICCPTIPEVDSRYEGSIEYDALTPKTPTKSLDPRVTAWIRQLRAKDAKVLQWSELQADRGFIDYPMLDRLGDFLEERMRATAVVHDDDDDEEADEDEAEEEGEDEGEDEPTAAKTLNRAEYTKEEWREVQKRLREEARERRARKVPKKEKKRAELLGRRRRHS
ncbi:putative RIO kinase 1 [Giardia muris]|uniref:non-specific serine/threonine protein kinase n=1 Tax=Giardia muris TaxID=5742 RepID=A0A4Z1SLD2_GIAMU|nr:putative RIO kinase 1 [Giardia muris]|eukprot:TNJ26446.1 putative RIO kinase 1 [Giardia muris]